MASPNKPGAVSVSTYGAISASTSDLWMIRLPNRLAGAWEDAPEGTVLGTLTFTKGGGGGVSSSSNNNKTSGAGERPAKRSKTGHNAPASGGGGGGGAALSSKISITIDPTLADSQSDLPVSYTLEAMSRKLPSLHPFTRGADGGVSIHGKVSRTASAQVSHAAGAGSSRYRTLLKNRLLDTAVNSKRFVQPGGGASHQSGPLRAATAAASLGSGFGGSVAQFGQSMMDARDRAKGLAGAHSQAKGPPITSAEEVRTVLFELFSKRTHWAVKDLRAASGGRLPERETREVLRDIADYHRQGEHRNEYELKPEFKVASSAGTNSGMGGQMGDI